MTCMLAQTTETETPDKEALPLDSVIATGQNVNDSVLTKKKDKLKDKASDMNVPRASLKRGQVNTDMVDSIAAAMLADSLTTNLFHQKKEAFVPNPIRSMWLAMVFPGAGQVYNHKYWKLPIIYGGFLGCVYAFSWNSQMLKDYTQAYLDIMDNDPNTKSYEKMLPLGYDITGKEQRFKDVFKNKKNYFRKYRDMSIFAFAGVYLISIIDAYVDAELSSFDISRDLTLQWEPTIMNNDNKLQRKYGYRALGLQCNLNF